MPRSTKTDGQDSPKQKAARKTVAGTSEVVWGGFINIRMDDHSKLMFEEWAESNLSEIPRFLEDAMVNGLKYGISWDKTNQCFIASLTGAGVANDPSRYCLTARAGSVAEATALLVFKDVVICQSDWGNYRPRDSSVLNWG